MRSLKLVKQYLKNGEYLEDLDNNGHTAWEMAYYENYAEALVLLVLTFCGFSGGEINANPTS